MAAAAQKVYGNNTVLFKGRFIGGPDAYACVASLVMISVPSCIWLVEVGSFFASRYSFVFLALELALLATSLWLMFATAFSDPGIVPRQREYKDCYDAATKQFRHKQPPRYYDIVLRGHPFKMKYCMTCNIYRPPRCTHCSVCDNCIERFDHHCPWIGNCVGKRNYWLFYSFVMVTGILNSFSLATATAHLIILGQEFNDQPGTSTGRAVVRALQIEPLSAALVVYCVGTVWFTVGLCVYHNYLICTNQTTYEQIKGFYCSGHNPFHRGILENYRDVLFSSVRPRYFDPGSGQLLWLCGAEMASSSSVRQVSVVVDAKAKARGGDSPGGQSDKALDTDCIDLQQTRGS